jgi:endonuclease/exonuclease/phosphatase family metal-dependent hydrolase
MKHFLIASFFVLMISPMVTGQTIDLMSYNIRFDNPGDTQNNWNDRKEMITDQLHFYEPDILGIQEGLDHQVKYLDDQLILYHYIGVGRSDGKTKGEYAAIFFNHRLFKPLEQGTFWLSETPEAASIGWDAAFERICTWVLLEHKKTGKQLRVFNTHFDHVGVQSRIESSKLIVKKINELSRQDEKIVLMGDFNATPDQKPIQRIKQAFQDSHDISKTRPFGPEGTFNGFNYNKPSVRRIDYIFVKNTKVLKYGSLNDPENLHFPSDHLPVFVTIQ